MQPQSRKVPREPTIREELHDAISRLKKTIAERANAEKAVATAEQNLDTAKQKLVEAESAGVEGRKAHKERLRQAARAGTPLLTKNNSNYQAQVDYCKQAVEDATEILQEMEEVLKEATTAHSNALGNLRSKRNQVMGEEHFVRSVMTAQKKLQEFIDELSEPYYLVMNSGSERSIEYNNLFNFNLHRRLEVMGDNKGMARWAEELIEDSEAEIE